MWGLRRDMRQPHLVVASFPYKIKASLPSTEGWLARGGEVGSRDLLPHKGQLISSLVLQYRKGKVGK